MTRYVLSILVILTVICLFFGDYLTLTEFYGAGPPYYSRTTNMDKWINPLPRLIFLNAAGIAIVLILLRLIKKDQKKQPRRLG